MALPKWEARQAWAWLALLALPASMALARQLRSGANDSRGPALNLILARTAQCALGFAILIAIGVLLT